MKLRKILPFALGVIMISSCKVPSNVTYFQDQKDGQMINTILSEGIKLKPEDKISIVVKSKNNEITNLLNLAITNQILGYSETSADNASRGVSGYTVDKNGNIDFPFLGKVKIAGMTREQVAETIKNKLEENEIAKDVVVTVEFLNLHFSVLGEVNHPGEYSFGRDKVTVVEALSKAGDMTLYGVRDSIYVLRTENGKQHTYVLSLLDGQSLAQSPAYYLQQNDVVYIQPNKYRRRQSVVNGNTFQTTSFWLSLVSVLTTLAVLFK